MLIKETRRCEFYLCMCVKNNQQDVKCVLCIQALSVCVCVYVSARERAHMYMCVRE